ncbi:RNA-dependent RNA polymerase [Sclerotinia sclerotiorum mitovirus 7]|uniref:RNA-dependent RNA polymerase n=1 Tax=Sclerotinia sclerotiorum mitovirus 7 TaxID=1435447 RepID=A0ABM5QFT1_9VIRU|nr:RNA-dependent RNA polymerase [Sclerotinia sclerotiorum mitovirus 7]AHX84135.1 RNA-dependent RNA polymerase [Sclerotinia sclerotiorum mitovirus 7]
MDKNKIDFNKLKSELCLIHKWYFPSINDPDIDFCIDRFERIFLTRGRVAAAEEMKASRLILTRWKSGHPLTGKVGAPLSKIDRLPKAYLSLRLRRALKNDPDLVYFRWAMTLLSCSRIILGGKPLNLKSITDPSRMTCHPEGSEIALALRKLGLQPFTERPTWTKFKWISSAGPNGLSIAQSLRDLQNLPLPLLQSLREIGGEAFGSAADAAKTFISDFPTMNKTLFGVREPETKYLRRLSVKADAEAKSRPFAILDYWTQSALTPLHDRLYSILRSIPQDCTFDQQKGVEMMSQYDKSQMFSLDLTAATDRFPMLFQHKVLEWFAGQEYADHWSRIMVGYPFIYEGTELKFNCGQPLGAKSSWAMFTLSHHVVMVIAAMRTNSPLSNYVILGDDVVIRTKRLASEYMRIMDGLGVDISPSKSHQSKGYFEFAKTWTYRGRPASGFPIKGVYSTIGWISELIPVLVDIAPMRGYPLPFSVGNLWNFSQDWAKLMTQYKRHQINLAAKIYRSLLFILSVKEIDSHWPGFYIQHVTSSLSRPIDAALMFKRALMAVVKEGKQAELERLELFAEGLMTTLDSNWASMEQEAYEDSSSDNSDSEKIFHSVEQELDMVASLPILASLEVERTEREEWLNYFTVDDPEQFWERFKSWDLPPFPQLKGLQPQRIKTRSQAELSLASKITKLWRMVG